MDTLFKKNFPAELAKIRARLPKGVEIELWWQDEARIGQKNKLTRRWARRGTRPRAPRDQRTEWAYIFGAICPAKGKGAGLVMPWCDTDAMAAHLIEITIVDQAGWHLTPKLAIQRLFGDFRAQRRRLLATVYDGGSRKEFESPQHIPGGGCALSRSSGTSHQVLVLLPDGGPASGSATSHSAIAAAFILRLISA